MLSRVLELLRAPFKGLSTLAILLQVLRVLSSLGAIVFVVLTLVCSLFSPNVYVGRVNCAHLDVSYGLYKSLRNSVAQVPAILQNSDYSAFPVDSSLTNSEIAILTDYAESQVASAAQYVNADLWGWCYGSYNTSKSVNKYGQVSYAVYNRWMKCTRKNEDYLYDYREGLDAIGLQSILAYAYQSDLYDGGSYSSLVKLRARKYLLVKPALFFAGASQMLILFSTVALYGSRHGRPDILKLPVTALNVVALLSMASFISVAVAAGVITRLLLSVRTDVAMSLGDFGVSFNIGSVWLLFLWLAFVFELLLMSSWIFPLWCANPSVDDFDDYEDDSYYDHHNTGVDLQLRIRLYSGHRRTLASKRKRSGMLRFMDAPPQEEEMSLPDGGKSTLSVLERYYDGKDGVKEQGSESDSDDDYGTGSRPQFLHGPHGSSTDDYYTKDEDELRKLGESLSRKTSVRRLHNKCRERSVGMQQVPEAEATKQLLYNGSGIVSHSQYPKGIELTGSSGNEHHREETYDGYNDAALGERNVTLNSSNSRNSSIKRDDNSRSRSNSAGKAKGVAQQSNRLASESQELSGPFQATRKSEYVPMVNLDEQGKKRESYPNLFLNEDEMNILDQNVNFNRVK